MIDPLIPAVASGRRESCNVANDDLSTIVTPSESER